MTGITMVAPTVAAQFGIPSFTAEMPIKEVSDLAH